MLASFLQASRSTVVFSGAGMSTESGLQDFRSADRGMWNNRNPVELADIDAMNGNRDEFVRFYRWRIEEMLKHQPNQGHKILAKWERAGVIKGIITQNVENYHEQAGTATIAKLHGDLGTLRCMTCGTQYPCTDYLAPQLLTSCRTEGCGGFVRPNVVLFGEMLSQRQIELANELLNGVGLFIVLGSSLLVSPANEFPLIAKRRGAKLVIVNRDPTPVDKYADLVIHRSIGEVLASADQEL
ncbi:NAD-dependent deacylase [Brevibacillus sp. B_LB10_24]|uniref:NAD-dependent deacylase n=1 Tax=Brevibacillus sp. B_LB10_24 TaxID=3380645 RepID=UPI0038B9DFB5